MLSKLIQKMTNREDGHFLVRVGRVELPSYPWQGYIIAAIRYPRARSKEAKLVWTLSSSERVQKPKFLSPARPSLTLQNISELNILRKNDAVDSGFRRNDNSDTIRITKNGLGRFACLPSAYELAERGLRPQARFQYNIKSLVCKLPLYDQLRDRETTHGNGRVL